MKRFLVPYYHESSPCLTGYLLRSALIRALPGIKYQQDMNYCVGALCRFDGVLNLELAAFIVGIGAGDDL